MIEEIMEPYRLFERGELVELVGEYVQQGTKNFQISN